MRKPSRRVELDDIISSQILGDDPEVIALTMKIHLALEAILLETIALKRGDDGIYKLSFPAKTAQLETLGLIGARDRQAFDHVNEFRNDFAHIFGHRVLIDDALRLARMLERLGVDFSDSIGQYSAAQAIEYHGGMLGVLEEIGWCVLLHAGYLLREAGGRDILS